MTMQITDTVWLNDVAVCRIEHLVEVSGLSVEEIEDLIEAGVIAPQQPDVQPRSFELRYVITVKTARRLRDDFQLDPHGVSLALTLLQRIGELEAQLAATRAKRGR
jgi:chaperone modulatory protein CbpM